MECLFLVLSLRKEYTCSYDCYGMHLYTNECNISRFALVYHLCELNCGEWLNNMHDITDTNQPAILITTHSFVNTSAQALNIASKCIRLLRMLPMVTDGSSDPPE